MIPHFYYPCQFTNDSSHRSLLRNLSQGQWNLAVPQALKLIIAQTKFIIFLA